jgi:hypothetical protein
VHENIYEPRVLASGNRDLEPFGIESRKLPERRRRSEGRDRLVTSGEAGGEQVLMPGLGCAGAPVHPAPNRLKTAGSDEMLELFGRTRFEHLMCGDQSVLATPDAGDLVHAGNHRGRV